MSPIPPHFRIAEKIARVGRSRGLFNHSILIHGPTGAGQREVALRFGQSVFCETGDGPFGACGECRNCRRVPQGLHPDFIWIEPSREKGLPNISIDTLREQLQDRLVLQPFEGDKVVGCVYEAEMMRPEAAGAMLKYMEEPPPHAVFIFVTENRERILPTIRSRCLPVPILSPAEETIEAGLVEGKGLSRAEAHQAGLWAANEGLLPEAALSEGVAQVREESVRLLDLAVREGEYAFIPQVKALKYDWETTARFVRHWRDLLRDCLLLAEGRAEPQTHLSETKTLKRWATAFSTEDLAELIDRGFEYEEGILGYANRPNCLATFLSEVSARSRASRV